MQGTRNARADPTRAGSFGGGVLSEPAISESYPKKLEPVESPNGIYFLVPSSTANSSSRGILTPGMLWSVDGPIVDTDLSEEFGRMSFWQLLPMLPLNSVLPCRGFFLR
jgi:hypothetical protein